MYDKNLIEKFIGKYYLNGLVDQAHISSSDGTLYTLFRNSGGNLRGEVCIEDAKLPDAQIGVYYTKNLLSYMSILDNTISVEFNGKNSDDSVTTVEMRDAKGRKIVFGASKLDLIEADGKRNQVKTYEAKIELDQVVIADILKGFSAIGTALSTQTIAFVKKDDKLYAIFGYSTQGTNQIEVELDAEVDEDFEEMIFPADIVKEVLTVNGKTFDKATLEISVKGLLTFKFEDVQCKAEYWVRKNS